MQLRMLVIEILIFVIGSKIQNLLKESRDPSASDRGSVFRDR